MENDIAFNNKISKFNFESLITIEEIISYFLNDQITLSKNNFINYYRITNYYLIKDSAIDIFKYNSNYSKIIHNLFNLQFITVLIDGLYLFNKNNNEIIKTIKDCLNKNHQNFLLLSQLLINELQKNNMTNIYSNKICKLILEKLKFKNIFNSKELFLEIENNNKEMYNNIKDIINTNKISFKTPHGISHLSTILNKISEKSTNDIFDFCLKMFDVSENEIKEIKNNNYLSKQEGKNSPSIYHSVEVPFLAPLKKEDNYILTIILDLDGTLIGFDKKENDEESEEYEEDEEDEDEDEDKKMILRPGLFEFLDNLIELKCELIVFTSSNKNYADKIIDEIEKNKKYFKKRLYRENCVLIGAAYVKDISKLGRDLSKVIIIDNDLACFFLQPENGILIKPFLVDNINEKRDIILNNLKNILYNIIKKPYTDIRIELEKYKEEIKNKVTN